MLKQSQKNEFEQAFYELSNLCKECKFKEEIDCIEMTHDCENYNKKFKRLYFDSLYPMHPCKVCLVRATCDDSVTCEEYNHHENMRDFAKLELQGHPNLISKEDLRQTTFNGERIEDIKNDPSYEEILDTEKQRFEFFSKCKSIKNEKDPWIITPAILSAKSR